MTARRLPVVAGCLVALAVVVLGVFPTRSYLAQRDDIEAEKRKVAVLRSENARLATRVEQLGTDAEIERLAREQYGLVKPGEEAYAILPGPADPPVPADAAAAAPVAEDESGFWGELGDAITFWN